MSLIIHTREVQSADQEWGGAVSAEKSPPNAARVWCSRGEPLGAGWARGVKLWLILQVALGATALAGAEPERSARPTVPSGSPGAAGPRIVFGETTFDFGKIKLGDVVRHEFVFTNTGDRMLEISRVMPGCGCTTIAATNQPIAPGETGVISVVFNARGLNGTISRPITVYANDPVSSNVVLRLRAEVWTPVEVQPSIAVFNHDLDLPTRETRTLRILNHLEHPVEVSIDGWTNRLFEVALKSVRPGKEFTVEIATVPPLPPGTVVMPLTLKISAPEVPSLTANICTMEQPPVVVAPKQLPVPDGPLAAPERRAVMVRNLGRDALSLSSLELDLAGVESQINEIQPGRLFSIIVTFPAGFESPRGRLGQLRVRSNHPRFAVMSFPLARTNPSQAAQTLAGGAALQRSNDHQ